MTPERAQDIVARMTGTCHSVTHFLEDGENELDDVLIEAIDAEIFCCNECGWWCELSDAVDNAEPPYCTSCCGM